MLLGNLIHTDEIDVVSSDLPDSLEVTGVTADSRLVKPGFIFVAIAGYELDGHRYIPDAIAQGAVVVIGDARVREITPEREVVLLQSADTRALLPVIASRFYTRQPEQIVAVTGTDGKTSVAHFCQQLWNLTGSSAVSLGTLGVAGDIPDGLADGLELGRTSLEPVAFFHLLDRLAAANVNALALEASSHGLVQHRLDGVRLKAAACTNITRDHMDFHGDFAHYQEAKSRLFTRLLNTDGVAVLNADESNFAYLKEKCEIRGQTIYRYGRQGEELRLVSYEPQADGATVSIEIFGHSCSFVTPLIGEFQAYNMLCAVGLVVACGVPLEALLEHLPKLVCVPGRMELAARAASGAGVFVDYAHTPNALKTVLTTMRAHVRGRLIVVFGCGGDRDKGKRPEMGAIAAELADVAVVTDDNPRTEDAGQIRREILAACPDAVEIADRREAIAYAVGLLEAGDILLVAGKGHESGQTVGTVTTPFLDAEVVREAVG